MKQDWLEATNAGDCDRVEVLLSQDYDIDARDRYGQTALMNAARRGDLGLVRLLIARGAALNHTAKYHLTALMLAVINSHPDIVRALVAAGADTRIEGSRASFARTPLAYALEQGREDIAAILRDGP